MAALPTLTDLLVDMAIDLEAGATTRDDAIRLVGDLLRASGAVDDTYTGSMLERETSVSTYIGEGIAIPHATFSAEGAVIHDALSFARFSEPIDWDGHQVHVAIGIAAIGRGHIGLLSRLAGILLEPDRAARLRSAESTDELRNVLADRV